MNGETSKFITYFDSLINHLENNDYKVRTFSYSAPSAIKNSNLTTINMIIDTPLNADIQVMFSYITESLSNTDCVSDFKLSIDRKKTLNIEISLNNDNYDANIIFNHVYFRIFN